MTVFVAKFYFKKKKGFMLGEVYQNISSNSSNSNNLEQKCKIIPVSGSDAYTNRRNWDRVTELTLLSFTLWAKIIVSNPSETPRCSGYFAVLSSHCRWIFYHQGEARQACLNQCCWCQPGEPDELALGNGPGLLVAPSHPPKCHTPPEALRNHSHSS